MADFAKSLFHFSSPFHATPSGKQDSQTSPTDTESQMSSAASVSTATLKLQPPVVESLPVSGNDTTQSAVPAANGDATSDVSVLKSKFSFFTSKAKPSSGTTSPNVLGESSKLPYSAAGNSNPDEKSSSASSQSSDYHSDSSKTTQSNGPSPPDPAFPRETNTSSSPPLASSSASSFSNATSSAATAAATAAADSVKPPKGRLIVKIIQARGLKVVARDPCPYVVCTFESNEFISEGPNPNGIDSQNSRISSFFKTADPNSIYGNGHILSTGSIAIPARSRQSSTTNLSELKGRTPASGANPSWKHEAVFDVLGDQSELDVSIYDQHNDDAFLGHARIPPILRSEQIFDEWYTLEPRGEGDVVSGEVRLQMLYETIQKRHYGPDDFEILRLIGKGTFGQVYQVRKKDTHRIYAMKVLSKKVILQKKEVAHTIGERNILVRTATTDSPFIVGLKFSFQTLTDLYLVTDYMSGGELFWHLQKEGRFSETRAKFYIAELILALEHLHNHDIVYRDLKPENILLDANGHIALCDFGLSKANLASNDTTNTFCGTTEYLAPEVLLDDQGYTKMVDFWSLGVLIFEMCCGWSPFYADDTQQMYNNIAFGKVRFPKDALSTEGKSFVKGLLNRNPKHRLGAIEDAKELKRHPFFADIEWELLVQKKVPPPFKPHLVSETDTSNFDPEFTTASTSALQSSRFMTGSTPLSPTLQANFQGFTFVDESSIDEHFAGRDARSDTNEDDDRFLEEYSHHRHNTDATLQVTKTRQGSLSNVQEEPRASVVSKDDQDMNDLDGAELSRKMSGVEFDRGNYSDDDAYVNGQRIDI
ncbi:kinase-like domain-containing protein [Lipomyces oligophaga]|uniref:kinase-like domain-containing protein n=1 Tax=Lipomyces oligophaga TaxID=45792 RepID=UPI0034CF3368